MKKFARYSATCAAFSAFGNALFFCCAFLPCTLSAQTDSIYSDIRIPEALIQEQRFSQIGYNIWEADSLPTTAVLSLTNRLFWENGLNLRQNAPGTLATISARGAGPNRTAVLWNGLSLQSPMNGVVDASLLPLWQGDEVEVRQGGNSAAQSNGAMGGSVMIETPFRNLAPGLSGQLGLNAGSFAHQSAQGAVDYVTEKTASRARASWQSAENNFPFQVKGLNGQTVKTKQLNNFAEKTDIQQFNQVLINQKNILKTAAWYQQSFRQIPAAITEAPGNTWQRDRSGRAVATWDFNPNPGSKLQSRAAWQDEYISFHFAGETEESRAQTALLGTEWRQKKSRNFEWKSGGTLQQIRATSDGYKNKGQWYKQTRLAGYAQGERAFARIGKVTAMLRQEWVFRQENPFTWTLGWESATGRLGGLRGHISRNFNLPTFNDRFWETLDSISLKAEKGYSADVGWAFKKRRFSIEITAFQLLLDNWILWQPSPNDGIFRPGNLRKVSSRGLEAASYFTFQRWGIQWKAKGSCQLSATENVAVYGGSGAVLGKQLPYTPRLSAGAGLWATRGGASAAYLHQFTGKRFVTTDNASELPSFHTGTLLIRYAFQQKACRWARGLSIDVMLDNIWDQQYESLANRPMPGRNWKLGLLQLF